MKNSIPPELMRSGNLKNVVLSEACIVSSSGGKISKPFYSTTSDEEEFYDGGFPSSSSDYIL